MQREHLENQKTYFTVMESPTPTSLLLKDDHSQQQ